MTLGQFLTASANIPFAVALVVVVGLFLIEVGLAALGITSAQAADTDVDLEPGGASEWLHLGALPTLVLFMLLALGFGGIGLTLQGIALSLGGLLNPWLASAIALTLSFPFVHLAGRLLLPIFNRDDSAAISADALIGHTAIITLSEARRGTPSQAKARDRFGTSHYVLVEPMEDDATLNPGQEVVLVSRKGATYFAVENDSDALFRSLESSRMPSPSSENLNENA